ncbi:MAG: DUF4349 domain-containing protein [Lachnospiraceae bacterium]|nr:DUF4349 domain-containing protein [Lachnospiraceae bacterium]
MKTETMTKTTTKKTAKSGLAAALAGVLTVILCVAALAGCAAGGSKSTQTTGRSVAGTAAAMYADGGVSYEMAEVPAPAAVAYDSVAVGGAGSATGDVYYGTETNLSMKAASTDGGYDATGDDQEESGGEAADPLAGRKLITEVNMTLETTAMDAAIERINAMVKQLGGYIESSGISGNSLNNAGGLRYADMTVRVPQGSLPEFMGMTGEIGNVLYKNESTRDITLQYTETEDRIKTLDIEQERLWELLAKAESIESIIALEQRLSEIRFELQNHNSRLRLYDNQVSYSTVYLSIQEVRLYTPEAAETLGSRIARGFRSNAAGVADFFTDLMVFIVTHIPALAVLAILVFVIVKLLGGIGGFFTGKGRRGRKGQAAPKGEGTWTDPMYSQNQADGQNQAGGQNQAENK